MKQLVLKACAELNHLGHILIIKQTHSVIGCLIGYEFENKCSKRTNVLLKKFQKEWQVAKDAYYQSRPRSLNPLGQHKLNNRDLWARLNARQIEGKIRSVVEHADALVTVACFDRWSKQVLRD